MYFSVVMYSVFKKVFLFLFVLSLSTQSLAIRCDEAFLPKLKDNNLRKKFANTLKQLNITTSLENYKMQYGQASRTHYSQHRGRLKLFILAISERLSTYYETEVKLSEFTYLLRLLETELLNLREGEANRIVARKEANSLKYNFDTAFDQLNLRELQWLAQESHQLLYLGSQSRANQNNEAQKITELITEFNKSYEEIYFLKSKKEILGEEYDIKLDEALTNASHRIFQIEKSFMRSLIKTNRPVSILSPNELALATRHNLYSPKLYTKRSAMDKDWSIVEFKKSYQEDVAYIETGEFVSKLEAQLGIQKGIFLPFWNITPTAEQVKQGTFQVNLKSASLNTLKKEWKPQMFFVEAVNFDPAGRMTTLEIQNTKLEGTMASLTIEVNHLVSLYNVILGAQSGLREFREEVPLENHLALLSEKYKSTSQSSNPIVRNLPKEPQNKNSNRKKSGKSHRPNSQKSKNQRRIKYKKKPAKENSSTIHPKKASQEDSKLDQRRLEIERKKKLAEEKRLKKNLKHTQNIDKNITNSVDTNTSTIEIRLVMDRLDKSSKKLLKQKKIRNAYYKTINLIRSEGYAELKNRGGFHVENIVDHKFIHSSRLSENWRLFFTLVEKDGKRFFTPLHISNHNYLHELKNTQQKLASLEAAGFKLK